MSQLCQNISLSATLFTVRGILTNLQPHFAELPPSFETQRSLDQLVELSNLRSVCATEDDRREVGNVFSSMVGLFSQLSNKLSTAVTIRSAADTDALVQTLASTSSVVSVLANVTDYSRVLCEKLSDRSNLERILKHLDASADTFQQRFRRQTVIDVVHGLLIVLYNVCRSCPEAVESVLQLNGISVVKRYVEVDYELIKMQSLFVLSFVLVTSRDEETDANSVVTKENIDFILKVLRACYDEQDHFSKEFGFQVFEVLQSISDIAHCSHRGVKYLVETTRLLCIRTLIRCILLAPTVDNLAQSASVSTFFDPRFSSPSNCDYVRFASSGEKLAAAHCCWAMSFDESGREALRALPGLVEALRAAMANGSSELQRIAYGALWNLGYRETTESLLNDEQRPEGRPSVAKSLSHEDSSTERRYVMISYQHQNSDSVRRIRSALRDADIDTWIDVENMSGNILNKIMKAVQQATVVVLCISASYKRSAYCRSEAENAFLCKKRVIPVRLDSYQPNGWLQAIVGAKYMHDLSDPEQFDAALQPLVTNIRAKLLKDNLRKSSSRNPPAAYSHNIAVTPPPTEFNDVPDTASDEPQSNETALLAWNSNDVAQWLLKEQLQELTGRLSCLDGPILFEMLRMERAAPKYLYVKLESEFQLSFIELMKFLRALHRINCK